MDNRQEWTQFDLSETAIDQLQKYNALLQDWSAKMNLVAKSTLPDATTRHFLDSAQVFPLIPPTARTLIDFGSGAGFPGIVLAILAADKSYSLKITLIETTGKKCIFLRHVIDVLKLNNITVQQGRIETSKNTQKADIITARALASLDKLLGYALPYVKENTLCLFLKGQNLDAELTEAATRWSMKTEFHTSITAQDARIAVISEISTL